jgi:ClpP class serine protease
MKRKKKETEAEREAWDRHVDETIRTLREIVKKGRAALREQRAAETG